MILDDLKEKITPIGEKYDLAAVYVFGSYARGDETPHSDVDVLIDRHGSLVNTLFDVSGVRCDLAESLHKPIDILTVQSLAPNPNDDEWDVSLRDSVMRERVKVYERK